MLLFSISSLLFVFI